MRTTFAILASFLLVSCAVLQKPAQVNLKPTSVSEFLDKPFGHNESVNAFREAMPQRTKIQKLIRRSGYAHHRPDTIYNFKFKKSKIAVYRTQFNQEFLLGGFVKNGEIEMVNGIRAGMYREAFYSSFTDLEAQAGDSIVLKHPMGERTFRFYFDKRSRLKWFSFTGNAKK